MSDQGTIPPYAVELARIAMLTVLRVQEREGQPDKYGRRTYHIPDERDFEIDFGPYVERIRLESEIRIGSLSTIFKTMIDKVAELDRVQRVIDALENERKIAGTIRRWKNTGVVKP